MTQQTDMTLPATYEASELTADQQQALILQCNDAYARARLRKLRALILFAQSEPETIPGFDEDTGTFGPRANLEAMHPARSLAMHAMESPACAPLLKELRWTDETAGGDWDAMLRHLPASAGRSAATSPLAGRLTRPAGAVDAAAPPVVRRRPAGLWSDPE